MDEGGVRREDGPELRELPGRRDRTGAEGAGLERASETDGAALGDGRLDLVGRVVIGEALGVVVDVLTVGKSERPSGGREKRGDQVPVGVGGDRRRGDSFGALGKEGAELGVARGVVAEAAHIEQPASVVNHRGGQRGNGGGRSGGLSRSQTAVHPHERHGLVLLPGHMSCAKV
jgi:hypothetical protein